MMGSQRRSVSPSHRPGPLGCSLFDFLAIMTHIIGSAVTIKGLQRGRARLPVGLPGKDKHHSKIIHIL